MAKNTRKCSICKKEFDITEKEYLKSKGLFMEIDCFISKEKRKGLSDDTIQEKINIIKKTMEIDEKVKKEKEMERERKKLKSKQLEIERQKYKDEFIKYIITNYNLSTIPKVFYIKLSQINNGTFNGLTEGISYEDLLYIFKRKQKYFDKIYLKNISKGKVITGISRVNYDLTIAISLYDEYKRWKRKQQILASDIINEQKIQETNKDKEINYLNIKIDKGNDSDISDILSDLY